MMEILFFAFLTGYIVFRLWSILGKRTGFEAPPPPLQESDNVITLPVRTKKKLPQQEEIQPTQPQNPLISDGVKRIQAADPAFNLDHFLKGAIRAYEIITEAFAVGNKNTLKPLLSPSVYKSFITALQERQEASQTVETKIIDIKDPEIISIDIKGKQEQITVKFVSEQVVVTKDAEGKILDNPAHLSLTMNDIWTFNRTIKSENPNWVLIATRVEGN